MIQEKAPVLEFNDVCFAYEREEILHNVSLHITHGNLAAVVGPNGAGKSTLIKLALGLVKPLRGTVKVFGQRPAQVRRRIGYVPQYLQFDDAFPVSVLDVVLMGRTEKHFLGPYRRTDKTAALQALEKVSLADFAKRGFNRLSGGERQRVLIAQALVAEPDLLLLDEPTANVDTVVEHEIYELITRLNKSVTIMIVSHNLNVVIGRASHIICVNRTASIVPMHELTDDKLHAVYRNDIAVLQHHQHCHVIDPSGVMAEPHHAGRKQK